jgi:hypothetical protein
MKSWLSLVTILISLALLIPGVTQPILSIEGSMEKAQMTRKGVELLVGGLPEGSSRERATGFLGLLGSLIGLDTQEGEVQVFEKSRSIWGTIVELEQSGNGGVALLVMLFSVLIPALKLCLMLLQHLPLSSAIRRRNHLVIQAIGKWSMADVFVVALIVTQMVGDASAGLGGLLKTQAQFEVGFYFFTAYCLFSILSAQLLPRQVEARVPGAESKAG